MKIETLKQFEEFLKTRIPTREALFMGDIGLRRAKHFMKLLGDPQNKIKVIHIAGTSGKGSTAYLASHLLQSQGFKVGLSISPHVFDIRERMQINNELPNEKLILKYFHEILPVIEKMKSTKYGMPTFFEINVALAFYMFAKEKVDYAVAETGLGGTLDATNTVTSKNKICILTKIGLDHTEILGNTVTEIAAQKAGIINEQNTVINIQQAAKAQTAVNKKCAEQRAQLFTIKPEKNYSLSLSTPQRTIFNFFFLNLNLQKISLGLIGAHQAENCSLALACLTILSERDDFNIDEKMLRCTLRNIKIPGRLEILKIKNPASNASRSNAGWQTVIIDGAHNPQKMQTFTSNLSAIYPNKKFTFLVAFKKGKDFQKMLKFIMPLADKILLTQFSTSSMDNYWSSTDNATISKFLEKQNFKNFKIIPNGHSGFLQNVRMSSKPVVITGSLYFIGSIYKYLKK